MSKIRLVKYMVLMVLSVLVFAYSGETVKQDKATKVRVEKTEKVYTQCITVTLPRPHSAKYIASGDALVEDRIFNIPEGWTPVGPAATNGVAVILLCR